ncbi:MAG: FliH/SctL family protein [Nocardioides sp.]
MSSSTDLLRGADADAASALPTPELRDGSWTRFGDGAVLGDAVTEQVLDALAQSTRRVAHAQGYAVGWAEGRREAAAASAAEAVVAKQAAVQAEARRESDHRAAVAGLARAAQAFAHATAAVTTDLEQKSLGLARELTEQLVGHELRIAPDRGADAVRRALILLPTGLPVTVRLHPSVAADPDLRAGLEAEHVKVVADQLLSLDDAVLETDDQVIDLALGAALERVRQALS